MNANICNSATIGDSKQLIDERDGKYYWVTKLKDERCWMTQNLDLDLTRNRVLTPSDTDIAKDWIPANTAEETIKAPTVLSTTNWPNDNATIRSYDPGYNVFVDGITSKPATEDLANGKASGEFTIEDAHYLQGNYYSFVAATASSGSYATSDGSNASDSICPKGWKLPLSGSSNGLIASAASTSFGLMLNKQGITNNASGYNNITKSEYLMYFVRGGGIANGSLTVAGSQGYYWSSTSYNASFACGLHFNNSNVYPSNYNDRHNGFSVRCVAR